MATDSKEVKQDSEKKDDGKEVDEDDEVRKRLYSSMTDWRAAMHDLLNNVATASTKLQVLKFCRRSKKEKRIRIAAHCRRVIAQSVDFNSWRAVRRLQKKSFTIQFEYYESEKDVALLTSLMLDSNVTKKFGALPERTEVCTIACFKSILEGWLQNATATDVSELETLTKDDTLDKPPSAIGVCFAIQEGRQVFWKLHKRPRKVTDDSASVKLRCGACLSVPDKSKFCTRCRQVYCGAECQTKDWPNHKAICRERATNLETSTANKPVLPEVD
jgi:hypothetical protein